MTKKILIVEDNPPIIKAIRMALRVNDYVFIEASDGDEALRQAVSSQPDLIIMDIQLPKMSGLDVTKALRKMPEFRCTPIIGITAYAMKGDKDMVLQAGCDMYMSKPFSTRELPGIIETLLARDKKSND